MSRAVVSSSSSPALGGWLTNDGTASKSLVVGDSGTVPSPTWPRQPFMAVDGDVTTQWNAAIDASDKSCWLVLDFGSAVTIHGFALLQRGDTTHDAKDHELLTGATKDGPWVSAGSFVAKECKPPAFTARQCREKNQPGAAAFRQAVDLPSPATSRYFRWVAKTRYSEYQLYLYEIEFRFSNWGEGFLLLVALGGTLYLGGGVALAAKSRGAALRLGSHPHAPRWVEVHGLCLDGVGYARGLVLGQSRSVAGARISSGSRGAAGSGGGGQGRGYGAMGEGKGGPGGRRDKNSKSKTKADKSKSKGTTEESGSRGGAAEFDEAGEHGVGSGDSEAVNNVMVDPAAVLTEQAMVGARLHQSQAKIKVVIGPGSAV
jgi:hypothetical protein